MALVILVDVLKFSDQIPKTMKLPIHGIFAIRVVGCLAE